MLATLLLTLAILFGGNAATEIPYEHECVLPDRETVVADTDPRCLAAYPEQGPSAETIVPFDADPATTAVTCWDLGDGGNVLCVPTESPSGGEVIDFLDNSPAYSDGWVLEVDDASGHVEFIHYGYISV